MCVRQIDTAVHKQQIHIVHKHFQESMPRFLHSTVTEPYIMRRFSDDVVFFSFSNHSAHRFVYLYVSLLSLFTASIRMKLPRATTNLCTLLTVQCNLIQCFLLYLL